MSAALSPERELLTAVYAAFNARDVDAVLAVMHADVDWPNGWEGGRVTGHAGVREYWLRQWESIDPRVTPLGISVEADGRTAVAVHAVVRERGGALLFDGTVTHVYTLAEGLIRRMDIRP